MAYSGFTRTGFYGNLKSGSGPFVSSTFSDFGFKGEGDDGAHFKAYADLRFRYGTEFREQVSAFSIREAYINISGKKWALDAGQQILKWGRADFTNPTSRFSPVNYISRSSDQEDMDLGNLLLRWRLYPSRYFTLEAVAAPLYRSSVLLTSPLELPSYVKLDGIDSLVSGHDAFSYGLKGDLHFGEIDMSLSWFDGFNPMPGIALTAFNLDMSGPVPVPYTRLSARQYRIRNIGFDFETALGNSTIRGEAAYTIPDRSYKIYEYIPMKELNWVLGYDRTFGDWRITGEYSGKFIPGFTGTTVDPIFGQETDISKLISLMSAPGFDLREYTRQEVGSFNRLCNYQLRRAYHSLTMRVEADLFYSRLNMSLMTRYNIVSRDLLLMPELSYKPSDGLTIKAGADFYSGTKGSVYDIIDDFMNCIKIGVRVDF